MQAIVFFVAAFALCANAQTPATWLSTSKMICPSMNVRGSVATCTAYVEYLPSVAVVDPAELLVRHDGCTHAAPSACTIVATITSTACNPDASGGTICEHGISFPVPSDFTTGGTYTLSLTRAASTDPVRTPETIIVQGVVPCGALGHSLWAALGVIGLALMSMGLV